MIEEDYPRIRQEVEEIARRAGAAIMDIYATDFESRTKDDASPVTDADVAAEAVIKLALSALTPGTPIVAEESVAAGNIPEVDDGPFWLVDPLDGTKEFLKRNGEFTVNIALIRDRKPVLGTVYLPAKEVTYSGLVGDGATKTVGDQDAEAIATRSVPAEGLTVVGSRSHGDLF